MYKINHIKIGGFRRLNDLDLPIRPFMVLIGANGVGKTSLLDAYSLLSASAAGGLNSKLSQFGGVSSVLFRDKADSISLFVNMDVPVNKPLEYELKGPKRGRIFYFQRSAFTISRELYRSI
jgi:predicted ATPase